MIEVIPHQLFNMFVSTHPIDLTPSTLVTCLLFKHCSKDLINLKLIPTSLSKMRCLNGKRMHKGISCFLRLKHQADSIILEESAGHLLCPKQTHGSRLYCSARCTLGGSGSLAHRKRAWEQKVAHKSLSSPCLGLIPPVPSWRSTGLEGKPIKVT